MYCRVHKPIDTPNVSDNKGSCSQLVDYLSKELEYEKPYYDNFFSNSLDFVSGEEVLRTIDNNHKTLKRKDDKFYMLTINPSQHEIQHLIEKVTGIKVNDFESLSIPDQEKVLKELKQFARLSMDEYARNFYRDKIENGGDLVWFGRLETERHYKSDSEEVKKGIRKEGEKKPGLQLHVHIIVSRMDKTQTVSLSPLTKSRGNVQVLDGKRVVKGFDRTEWANRCATKFSYQYNYLPYYVKNHKEWTKWNNKVSAKNMAIRELKKDMLQGELHYERKLLSTTVRAYRFIVNPKAAFINQLRHLGLNIIKGKIL